jgi:hypothetical protein
VSSRTDAQRIAHRYRWHAVWLPRCCLHGNSPPLLQPIFLLLACCTQEDGRAGAGDGIHRASRRRAVKVAVIGLEREGRSPADGRGQPVQASAPRRRLGARHRYSRGHSLTAGAVRPSREVRYVASVSRAAGDIEHARESAGRAVSLWRAVQDPSVLALHRQAKEEAEAMLRELP